MDEQLSCHELERYRRQLMLSGFAVKHQLMLKKSTAFVAGVGGLGGTAALYLAAAGIGKMVLVHSGALTLSNMNRQILMKNANIGTSRVFQAKKAIEEINPQVRIEIFDARITPDTIRNDLRDVQIVLSARPNFEERRLLNSACVRKGIPMVEAAMNGMEGYIFNVVPRVASCIHCLYPEDDPEWEELGFPVLGAVSGMLGCMMAVEAVKLLTGYGQPLLSRMLVFNLFDMDFRKVTIPRDPECAVCAGV